MNSAQVYLKIQHCNFLNSVFNFLNPVFSGVQYSYFKLCTLCKIPLRGRYFEILEKKINFVRLLFDFLRFCFAEMSSIFVLFTYKNESVTLATCNRIFSSVQMFSICKLYIIKNFNSINRSSSNDSIIEISF